MPPCDTPCVQRLKTRSTMRDWRARDHWSVASAESAASDQRSSAADSLYSTTLPRDASPPAAIIAFRQVAELPGRRAGFSKGRYGHAYGDVRPRRTPTASITKDPGQLSQRGCREVRRIRKTWP